MASLDANSSTDAGNGLPFTAVAQTPGTLARRHRSFGEPLPK
jgi:hypothetical protein